MSWIRQEKWDQLASQQRKKFLPICSDFAVELVSESDEIETLEKKMQEYINNGLSLSWLIIAQTQTVKIYRPNQLVEVLQSPQTLSGEEILPQFILDLKPIWNN